MHLSIGKPANPTAQYGHRHTLDGVEIHRRAARDGVRIGFEDNLAGESAARGGARSNQHAP